jgi:hypothetical protein
MVIKKKFLRSDWNLNPRDTEGPMHSYFPIYARISSKTLNFDTSFSYYLCVFLVRMLPDSALKVLFYEEG